MSKLNHGGLEYKSNGHFCQPWCVREELLKKFRHAIVETRFYRHSCNFDYLSLENFRPYVTREYRKDTVTKRTKREAFIALKYLAKNRRMNYGWIEVYRGIGIISSLTMDPESRATIQPRVFATVAADRISDFSSSDPRVIRFLPVITVASA